MSKYPNSGILGVNKRKEKDSHPGYTGQCEVDGKEFWISAWVKEGNDGRFFSLAFKPKIQSDKSSPPTGGKNDKRPPADDFNDDIPF